MAAPAKSSAPVAASAHPSAEQKEVNYPMPSALTTQEKVQGPIVAPPPAAPTATEIVERPPPRTLARGRVEARAATIWIVVLLGGLVLLMYALYRLRRGERAKQRALAAATSALRRPREAKG